MTKNLDRADRSQGDRARARAYLKEFAPAMLGYVLILPLVLIFGGLEGTSGWRYLWAVLPVLPLGAMAVAVARHLRRADELQQRLLLWSLACGFGVAMLTTLTLGLLRLAGLDLAFDTWLVFAAGMTGWGVAGIVAGRR